MGDVVDKPVPLAEAGYAPQAARTLRHARASAELSLRELARRAGTSHSTLLAYEKGYKAPTVVTFLRILEACGFAIDIHLAPRIRERDGLDRGTELMQVLELADQFPSRPGRKLRYPKFGFA